MAAITDIAELEAIYGEPAQAAIIKVTDHITPTYRRFIEASPFMALATVGPQGLDCSPRGDRGNVVTCVDNKTLMLPDRRGNNRMDCLRNIISDPRISLMFLVPGSNTVLRVNGRAIVTADKDICARFETEGKLPRSVIAIDVQEVYFQCARAVMRADLWNPEAHVDAKTLPTPGEMLSDASGGKVSSTDYDSNWPQRAAKTLW
ncbi:MAG TPA: pyridoxamine 5'-phosphate oxidase family protein [Devosia sp.]|nr:pyridoxamine 5'-phosphate oxidase family protein [Devosia sp.]